MTCKDCIHYEPCFEYGNILDPIHGGVKCDSFKSTADVVPKSEVDRLEYTLLGVMHSVDKWLEGDELKQDEVNRAITMREKTLRIIEGLQEQIANKKAEVARDIIADLVKFADDKERQISFHGHSVWYIDADDVTDFVAELKKKYTEDKK